MLSPHLHTWCCEVEEVPDADGDVVLHGRQGGARVQHIGTKVAELPGLMVGQAGQAHGLRNLAGIC